MNSTRNFIFLVFFHRVVSLYFSLYLFVFILKKKTKNKKQKKPQLHLSTRLTDRLRSNFVEYRARSFFLFSLQITPMLTNWQGTENFCKRFLAQHLNFFATRLQSTFLISVTLYSVSIKNQALTFFASFHRNFIFLLHLNQVHHSRVPFKYYFSKKKTFFLFCCFHSHQRSF